MNDRVISILDNYDISVLRTWKGRSAILCETEKGIKILREYRGPREKLCVLEAVTNRLKEAGFITDCILRNKEGELCTSDRDQTSYIVKDYVEGRECSVTDVSDCVQAVRELAAIHKELRIPPPEQRKPLKYLPTAAGADEAPEAENAEKKENGPEQADKAEQERKPELEIAAAFMPELLPEQNYSFRMFSPEREYERYNRELRRIRKRLRDKSTQTDFEVFLLKHYGFFMEQAVQALNQIKASGSEAFCREQARAGMLCHGDFQYHNILFTEKGIFIMNYEKCVQDVQIRDFYLFFRKIMEKNNWNQEIGEQLIRGYDSVRGIDSKEMEQLYLRLCYPEKFRKVVSFYYNSGKSWIPGKNREKLERMIVQEQARQRFLEKTFAG